MTFNVVTLELKHQLSILFGTDIEFIEKGTNGIHMIVKCLGQEIGTLKIYQHNPLMATLDISNTFHRTDGFDVLMQELNDRIHQHLEENGAQYLVNELSAIKTDKRFSVTYERDHLIVELGSDIYTAFRRGEWYDIMCNSTPIGVKRASAVLKWFREELERDVHQENALKFFGEKTVPAGSAMEDVNVRRMVRKIQNELSAAMLESNLPSNADNWEQHAEYQLTKTMEGIRAAGGTITSVTSEHISTWESLYPNLAIRLWAKIVSRFMERFDISHRRTGKAVFKRLFLFQNEKYNSPALPMWCHFFRRPQVRKTINVGYSPIRTAEHITINCNITKDGASFNEHHLSK